MSVCLMDENIQYLLLVPVGHGRVQLKCPNLNGDSKGRGTRHESIRFYIPLPHVSPTHVVLILNEVKTYKQKILLPISRHTLRLIFTQLVD